MQRYCKIENAEKNIKDKITTTISFLFDFWDINY